MFTATEAMSYQISKEAETPRLLIMDRNMNVPVVINVHNSCTILSGLVERINLVFATHYEMYQLIM
jgi:hypothetical protein